MRVEMVEVAEKVFRQYDESPRPDQRMSAQDYRSFGVTPPQNMEANQNSNNESKAGGGN